VANPWAQHDANDARVVTLRRFRNFALFWIAILVGYFLGIGIFLEAAHMAYGEAAPVLMLILGCILVATIWHAAAIVTMTLSGTLDRK